jgi:hypothetical protein
MTSSADVSRTNGAKGGRPVSPVKRLTERKSHAMLLDEESPMDVMADNLMYWHRKVQLLQKQFEEFLAHLDPADADDRREFVRLMNLIVSSRERSQQVAVDLAPYVHPKLQAIAIQTSSAKLVIEGGLPDSSE